MTERSLFLAAMDIDDPTKRSAYLDRACADAPALRAQVEALLNAHEHPSAFMERLGGELAAALELDDARTLPVAEGNEELDFLDPSDKPGSIGRLGHYEVQELVGRGGMGVVLRAFDEKLHRVVAIKVMAPQLATSATGRRRFSREARAAAAVTHDHIVTIHAVEDTGPLPYIVMQYVAGTSLQDRLDRTGPLQLHEILRIGMQTASGLAAAHAQGLVHRDIKPANILLENGVERVKLTDFGLARAADDASLTQSGTVAGTPSFMSPEQAEGRPVDPRSDLFSLGSVLYALCTGRAPFRAGTSMATLKRVCEETPTPIRQTNPEVPDWLAAVVEKLHAKDPAERFQSAAEVAELLGQQLAHVQHPSVVPLAARAKAEGEPLAQPMRYKRWASVAAVLVALFAVLGTTEATGFTNVRTTIVRVFTPDGTLVVQTDDPDVKVTIEGDGGLILTGAGLEEIRLKPGSYRVVADRDGKRVALDRELVTVSRHGREIVRVKLEAAPPAPLVKTEKGAFVLLTAGKEHKFDTLADAVMSSASGDTIEIRGNGPFVCDPIRIARRSLVIRAGSGFQPILVRSERASLSGEPLLSTDQSLVLEGLHLQFEGLAQHKQHVAYTPLPVLVYAEGHALYLANCQFSAEIPSPFRFVEANVPECVVCNSATFSPSGMAVTPSFPRAKRLVIENCIHLGQLFLSVEWWQPIKSGVDPSVAVRLTRNTFVTPVSQLINVGTILDHDEIRRAKVQKAIRFEASLNIFDVDWLLQFSDYGEETRARKLLDNNEAEIVLRELVTWKEQTDLYHVGKGFTLWTDLARIQPTHGPRSLAEWKEFWKQAEISAESGLVRYQGGDLFTKQEKSPGELKPQDFRLRPDSAGYRAGKDKKDLGADVDLVGPGLAYERWKQTPEYQQWLKETGQLKK